MRVYARVFVRVFVRPWVRVFAYVVVCAYEEAHEGEQAFIERSSGSLNKKHALDKLANLNAMPPPATTVTKCIGEKSCIL